MFRNTTATPSDTIYASTTTTTYDTTYPDPVNCQWDTCMQQFSCIAFLAQHIEKAHMLKKIMKDNVCLWKNCSRNKKPFKYRYLLVEHLQSHTGEKPNICPYQDCNKILSSSYYLKVHIQRHTGEMPYKCQVQGCERSFVNSTECTRHQKTHSKQRKSYSCTFPGCDKSYTDPISLKRHSIQKHTQRKKTSNETSHCHKCDNCVSVQSLQNNGKSLNKKHYKHHNKRHKEISKVELQATPLTAEPPQQHPYHAHTENGYLSSPVFETIFDAEYHSNYFPDNSHLVSQSNSPSQSSQLSSLFSHNERLVVPSLSSMTSSNNLHSYPQSAYKQCVPNLLPSYEDIQSIHYKSPLTTIQQPIMSHQQD